MPQKVIVDKFSLIRQVSLFSELQPYHIEFISKKTDFFEYKKDDFVYREGDPPDAFYLIISGRVKVYTKRPGGEIVILEHLHRGSYFGIISLLTGEPHSVTAQVVNDSILLRINKEDFYSILKSIPQLAVHFSSTLARRLKRKDLGQKSVFESTIISVYGIQDNIGSTLYALNLAKALYRETKKGVIFLDMAPFDREGAPKFLELKEALRPFELMDAFFDEVRLKNSIIKHDSGINILRIPYGSKIESYKTQIIPVLTYLTNFYDYCIVDLPHKIDEAILTVLDQSDLIHIITDCKKEGIESANNFIAELGSVLRGSQKKVKIIVNEINGGLEARKLLKFNIYATLADRNRSEQEYNLAVRRIAREIGEVLVGLALGAGAAWGMAHIGVIKVLEREGIHIDVVAGSSMGALIGAFWAAGNTGADMERIAIENKNRFGFSLKDLKFPIRGLISDEKTLYFLRRYLGAKTFQDIRFPLKIVAADLQKREELIIDSGGLAEAVRASISIPGVYSPVRRDNNYLIDGGILDPVPVSVLLKMGVKRIIAVNTLPSPSDVSKGLIMQKERLLKEEAEFEKQSAFKRFLFGLKKRISNFFMPNIIDTITNSIEVLEYSMAEVSCRQADVVIHPSIAGWLWRDFLNPEKLVLLGEEACLGALPEIKRLIEE